MPTLDTNTIDAIQISYNVYEDLLCFDYEGTWQSRYVQICKYLLAKQSVRLNAFHEIRARSSLNDVI